MTVGEIFKVMVWQQTDDGGFETMVELTAPREMLAQFAPQAVAAALGTTTQDAEPPKMAMEGPTETPEQATQRRKRRTKAEMEASRAAETVVTLDRSLTVTPIVQMPAPVYPEQAGDTTEHARAANMAEKNAYNPFGGN
jgi:hypothetical protein